MRRILIFATILVAFSINLKAQLSDYRLERDDWQGLQVSFTVGNVEIKGDSWISLGIDGYMPSTKEGAPQLPVFSRLIEVPICDGFKLDVKNAIYDTLSLEGGRVWPAQPSRSKSDTATHKMVIDGEIYSQDAFFGFETAQVEAIGIARDRRLARLQFSPVRYNPTNGLIIVCRQATVTVSYQNVDQESSLEVFNRYFSPAFTSGANTMNSLYPKAVSTAAPIRYLIVAHSMFRGQLDSFVEWKRRKGFITDIVYTDEAAVGTTTTSIAAYLQGQYTNATATSPAPTYVLIVGDHEQIPAFTGTTSTAHITDLYYISWTSGDNIPDCYCGRFSAQSVAQLTPQIEKTLMYEQYTFADPTFLDRAVMVAGVDGGSSGDYGYTHADPAMDYAITNYINGAHGFSQIYYVKNNTAIVPTATNVTIGPNGSSYSATVRSYYNQGAGWINYSAHGSATSWGTPNFTTSHAEAMTNTQKFGIMIGNCCLTNKFQTSTCLGEAVLRKGNYCGAVGYIGGSNSTYWNEDFYWAVGVRSSSSIGPSMSMAYNASNLGAYDRLCHTHGEAYSNWVASQGALMMAGNMAVQASTSSRQLYYWEIYHLMGDPSVMVWLTQADTMTVSSPVAVVSGTTAITVSAVPYAYIALTDTLTHTLVNAVWTDASGMATLQLPTSLSVGGYEIVASAQQYRTAFKPLNILPPTGAYAILSGFNPVAPLTPGAMVPVSLTFVNPGDSVARNVVAHISTTGSAFSLTTDTVHLDSLSAGGSVTIQPTNLAIQVPVSAADGDHSVVSTVTTWNGGSQPTTSTFTLSVGAPVINVNYSGSVRSMMPGSTANINVTLVNTGHGGLPVNHLNLVSPTALLTVSPADTSSFMLAAGASITRQFSVVAATAMPSGIDVPLMVVLAPDSAALASGSTFFLHIGNSAGETFENSAFSLEGWTQGTYPWVIDDTTTAAVGTHCARSCASLGNSQTSELTISRNVIADDSVAFWYKVSSESSYDKFHFYIDGNEMVVASGEVGWTHVSYPVGVGTHTFRFTYSKDGSIARGSDCAWIDEVMIPSIAHPATFINLDLCMGEVYMIGNHVVPTNVLGSGAMTCGSDTVVTYTVHPSYNVADQVFACDSFMWNGNVYLDSFSFSQSLQTVYGCDSSVSIAVVIGHSVYDTIEVTTQANNYNWSGHQYTESGVYEQRFAAAGGCDSIVTLVLTFDHPSNGVDSPEGQILSAWPTPTAGLVMLSREVPEVKVYSMDGRQLLACGRTDRVDIGSLPAGVYMLVAGESILKIVKQ